MTSGPTRVPLDDVRFISSRSSGRLGVEIARELLARGANVTFIYGADSMGPDSGEGTCLIKVETIDDLIGAIEGLRGERFDVIIHAMAVPDFAPENPRKGKVSSKEVAWHIKLISTPKVIRLIRQSWPKVILVGFKLEVDKDKDGLIESAKALMSSSGADIVVANDIRQITDDTHVAYIVADEGCLETAHSKREITVKLTRLIEGRLASPDATSALKSP